MAARNGIDRRALGVQRPCEDLMESGFALLSDVERDAPYRLHVPIIHGDDMRVSHITPVT